MTEPDRYGEEIRRALSAAAELVVPTGDGLDIIRKRAARRPPVIAWLLAYVSYLPRLLVTRVQVIASELAVMAKGESDLLPRLWSTLRSQAGQVRPTQAWLRPALAGAAALLMVVAVTFAVPGLRATITNQANNATGGGPGGGAGSGARAYGTGSRSPGSSGSSTAGYQYSRMQASAVRGPGSRGLIYITMPGMIGGTVPEPCVSGTPSGGTTPVMATSAAGSTDTSAAANAQAGSKATGHVPSGAPSCGPGGSSMPTTSPPVSTPPVSTPPVSTPPTSTPPTSTPPTSTPPTSTPPSSTSAAPTDQSTNSPPATSPTVSGSSGS